MVYTMMLARRAYAFHLLPMRPRTLAGAFRAAARPLSSSFSSSSGSGLNDDWPTERNEFLTASMTRSESTLAVASDALPGEDSDGQNEDKEGKPIGAPEKGPGVNAARILEFLRSDLGVTFFVGVPDSCLKHFCARIDAAVEEDEGAKVKHVIAANEGCSIGMAVGHYLATGNVPLVYMQNSGVGNALNPLTSAAHPEVYGIPMVLLVGWRGCPGERDEPQHAAMGRRTAEMLEAAGVEATVLPEEDGAAEACMARAFESARARGGPVAVLARPRAFRRAEETTAAASSSASAESPPTPESLLPTREQAISALLDSIPPSDVIVSTTGFASRELYELRESRGEPHGSDFLCVGSMGHAVAIAQGVAVERPDRTVWCLDGDGAALMHLGSMVSGPSSLGLTNFRHVLINNGAHESVGGQPTAASQRPPKGRGRGGEGGGAAAAADAFNFADIAKVSGYASAVVVRSPRALSAQLAKLRSVDGPSFIEVKVRMGARDGLGRPKHSTLDAQRNFRAFLDKGAPSKSEALSGAAKERPARLPLPDDGLLLTPGPLTTSEQTKLAMLHDFGSRDRRFVDLTAKVRRDILDAFPGGGGKAASDLTAVLLQGSGTFAVEAMLAQFVPRDKSEGGVVVLSNGAYGRRMAAILETNGRPYVEYRSPENAPLDPADVEAFLDGEGAEFATHVAAVHCETTTGVLNPLREISDAVASRGRRLLVDAMSAFGVVDVDPSTVPFRALAASSNKGLQGPPGVGFVVCEKTGLEESAGNASSLSLDLHAQWKAFDEGGEWRFTPPTHVMLGLSQALEEFKREGGTAGRAARYGENRDVLVAGMRRLGYETLLPDEVQAPVIVTFLPPRSGSYEFKKFYDLLSLKGFIIYPGKVATTPTFRVGCIGEVYPSDMERFVEAVEETMEEMGIESGKS